MINDANLFDDVKTDLIRDEGLQLKPYLDTEGKTTIGVGRNLTDNGISEDEARMLLAHDMGAAARDLDINVPWWRNMPAPARRALWNMSFNLGWPRLSKFKNMLEALHVGAYHIAAKEALDSTWAGQVGQRAHRIAALYEAAMPVRVTDEA